MTVNPSKSKLASTKSIFFSVLLAFTPACLYFAADVESGAIEMLLVAAFFFSIAAIFFLAIRCPNEIAILALLRWAFESFATFGRGYRLHFYGLLAVCGGLVYLVKAAKLLVG